MRETIALEAVRTPTHRDAILRAQGVPPDHEVPERVETLIGQAQALYQALAEPRGIIGSVSLADFEGIYIGEGQNEAPSPLPQIVREADDLALFAATLGAPLADRIKALFAENEPALGYMLDTIASDRADAAADVLAQHFLDALMRVGHASEGTIVLPYSPGYCGWHITGQRKLFAWLEPHRVGITLNPSCLMLPIKSVSGVLVAGPGGIHRFENDFDFCLDCATWECRNRIGATA
jgi:hypothetical protein